MMNQGSLAGLNKKFKNQIVVETSSAASKPTVTCQLCKNTKHQTPRMTRKLKRTLWTVSSLALVDPDGSTTFKKISKVIPPAPGRTMIETGSMVSAKMNPATLIERLESAEAAPLHLGETRSR